MGRKHMYLYWKIKALSQKTILSETSAQVNTWLYRLKPYKSTVMKNSKRWSLLRRYGFGTGSLA